jgi:hypothetical protein
MSNTKNNICRVVLSLSSNLVSSRYTAIYKSYPIKRETEKTYIIIKNTTEERIIKNDLLVPFSDYQNDTLSKMQYVASCLEEDLTKCLSLLTIKLNEDINVINKCNDNALEAYRNGYELKKI